ncbi:MAG: M4 family metallopeptidase, partial [Tolumonas sp.]|nr:M4 family metallopeptidase [Tolumonas sp.]
ATSNLIYQNESGALNESFSDMMGTSTEYYFGSGNWTIGEDITPGSNGIRNMANPSEDGDPDNYANRYTGTADNGGVHTNSGISNYWYYLLATDIGLPAAEQIAFNGFTSLNSTADFCDARAATIAVTTTYGPHVAAAWEQVGVTDSLCNSGTTNTGNAVVISNVTSKIIKGVKFQISWSTNVPSSTEVTFTCCGTYVKNELVTSHAYAFNGTKGAQYTYYVTSTDANNNTATAGPFIHQN